MSRLLLDESPLVILPSLAKLIGLNEAVILQQVHYWNQLDGPWTRRTLPELAEAFPFWSERTIRRSLASLREAELLKVQQRGVDRGGWYAVNYERLEHLETTGSDRSDASGQNGRLQERQNGRMYIDTREEKTDRQGPSVQETFLRAKFGRIFDDLIAERKERKAWLALPVDELERLHGDAVKAPGSNAGNLKALLDHATTPTATRAASAAARGIDATKLKAEMDSAYNEAFERAFDEALEGGASTEEADAKGQAAGEKARAKIKSSHEEVSGNAAA